MGRRSKAMFDRTERLPTGELPIILIEGCPEPNRVLGFTLTAGQAMIGTELIEAGPDETGRAFERRLVKIAKAKGEGIVSLAS
jgi:hypothetical protein